MSQKVDHQKLFSIFDRYVFCTVRCLFCRSGVGKVEASLWGICYAQRKRIRVLQKLVKIEKTIPGAESGAECRLYFALFI